MTSSPIKVLVFGDRRVPRPLVSLTLARIADPAGVEPAIAGARRVAVVGSNADLAAVLTMLMRSERLDVEVAHVRGGPLSWLRARRAISRPARRVPLIRDDTGTVLAGAASWLPPAGAETLHGEAVVDDIALFDGEASGVRIEPTPTMPGLRATLIGVSRRRWVSGRAAQLGTTGAAVVRDGVPSRREAQRSTFYRHTTGWLRVDC